MTLEAGQEATATFVIAWHFPHLRLKDGGRFYATRFHDAAAVAEHVAADFARLRSQTRLWHDTWYDSTLPYWFLDRTMLNTSILATSTAHRFANGRFYGWEGVGCCEGTCTHVWHYAHAVARLFPELERDLRRRTDFGTAQDLRSGMINFRGEGFGLAVDGQAGCVLRAYREHQMSADSRMLKDLWPRIKLAMECLIHKDDGEGLVGGPQHNTLDQPWFGKIAWISSLYLAALRACEEMAQEVGDLAYATKVHEIFARGKANVDRELFNGEYYVHIPDKGHEHTVGSHNGCEVDQVFGQSWAHQVGLGRILPVDHVKQALASLWKYNFAPDVGPFRKAHAARPLVRDGGRGRLDHVYLAARRGPARAARLRFLLQRVHERLRIPGGRAHDLGRDGRGRAGRQRGRSTIAIIPRDAMPGTKSSAATTTPARWPVTAFTWPPAASSTTGRSGISASPRELRRRISAPRSRRPRAGGTFAQKDEGGARKARVQVKWGTLALKTLALQSVHADKQVSVSAILAGKPVNAQVAVSGNRALITFNEEITIQAGQELAVELS